MVFSSLIFLFFFLPASLLLYWLSPRKAKNATLFVVSLIFYAWGEPVYIALLLLSTISDFYIGKWLQQSDNPATRRYLIILSVFVNLAVLGFFKYYAFLARNIELLTGIPMPDWDPPLPIGISFYTFQTLSYTIDVYRKKVAAQQSFINFGCFVSLFPQLIAGPIVRYDDIQHQLDERKITLDHFVQGSRLFLIGLGKKVLLANNIGKLWDDVQAIPGVELTAGTAWLGIIAFAFQIYFDFSGYSDMARGLGKMFGFNIPVNFRYPYMSQSITEFWRRWHITLGTWFREYVYIPLGGNRVGKWKLVRNIFIVWFLTGLWHGASWNFILWGLYFAVILWCEKFFVLKWLERVPRFMRHGYAWVLFLLGWVLFALPELGDIGPYVQAMFGMQAGLYNDMTLYLGNANAFVLILCLIGSTPLPAAALAKLRNQRAVLYEAVAASGSIIILLCAVAYLVDATFNPFLYFRF